MPELLEVYDLQSTLIGMQDRKEFYREIKQEFQDHGHITRKVKSIRLLLMNSAGRIYVQKRSKSKEDNAGMYDKTVGGHIVAGDSANMTVIKECAEEL
jgi:isopentenyldiphosphate isomerase